jgi:hypothetical protein
MVYYAKIFLAIYKWTFPSIQCKLGLKESTCIGVDPQNLAEYLFYVGSRKGMKCGSQFPPARPWNRMKPLDFRPTTEVTNRKQEHQFLMS